MDRNRNIRTSLLLLWRQMKNICFQRFSATSNNSVTPKKILVNFPEMKDYITHNYALEYQIVDCSQMIKIMNWRVILIIENVPEWSNDANQIYLWMNVNIPAGLWIRSDHNRDDTPHFLDVWLDSHAPQYHSVSVDIRMLPQVITLRE